MTTRPAIADDFANADQRLADQSHDAVRQKPLTAAAHASYFAVRPTADDLTRR